MATRHPRRNDRSPAVSSSLATSLFAGIVAYCVISLLAGQTGLIAMHDLSRRIARMEERIATLDSDNLSLRTASESLRYDPDRIAREARDLGYLRPGEKIIVLSNLAQSRRQEPPLVTVDAVLAAGASSGLPDRIVKILAMVTALAVLLASLLMSIDLRAAPRRRDT